MPVLHFSKRKATSTRYTPYLTFGSELWRAGWETSSSLKAEQSRSAISRRVSSFWFCARKLNGLRDFKAKHQAANTTRSQLWNRRVVKLKGDNDSPMVLTNAHTATTRTAKERATYEVSSLRSVPRQQVRAKATPVCSRKKIRREKRRRRERRGETTKTKNSFVSIHLHPHISCRECRRGKGYATRPRVVVSSRGRANTHKPQCKGYTLGRFNTHQQGKEVPRLLSTVRFWSAFLRSAN